MYSCHSILECYNLFSGVKLSIRSFCFIYCLEDLISEMFFNVSVVSSFFCTNKAKLISLRYSKVPTNL